MRRVRWRLRQRMASRRVLPSARLAGDVVLGLGVAARPGDGDAVDGGVDLAVAAAVEAVALVLPELTGIGATPAARASLASLAKRWAPAISPMSLAAVSGPKPGLGEQLRRGLGDELCDLGLERVGGDGEFAQPPQLVAGDPDARGLLGARQAPARSASTTSLRTRRCRAA